MVGSVSKEKKTLLSKIFCTWFLFIIQTWFLQHKCCHISHVTKSLHRVQITLYETKWELSQVSNLKGKKFYLPI